MEIATYRRFPIPFIALALNLQFPKKDCLPSIGRSIFQFPRFLNQGLNDPVPQVFLFPAVGLSQGPGFFDLLFQILDKDIS